MSSTLGACVPLILMAMLMLMLMFMLIPCVLYGLRVCVGGENEFERTLEVGHEVGREMGHVVGHCKLFLIERIGLTIDVCRGKA